LGLITAQGVDSSSASRSAAQILFEQDATSASDAVPGRITFKTSSTGGLQDAMTIDDAQNVGIGTTSPTHTLNVVGDLNVTGLILRTMRAQEFTSNGTWTQPDAGVTQVFVTAVGGGGGGGGFNSPTRGSGGGGAGGVNRLPCIVSGNVVVTVGGGGKLGNSNAGGDGGDTSFGSCFTAFGGKGAGYAVPGGDGGGVNTTTVLNILGSDGGSSGTVGKNSTILGRGFPGAGGGGGRSSSISNCCLGGNVGLFTGGSGSYAAGGGASFLARGGNAGATGDAGTLGSGGGGVDQSAQPAGAGGNGYVLVEWYE